MPDDPMRAAFEAHARLHGLTVDRLEVLNVD